MATISILEDNNFETVYIIWLDACVNQSQENLDAQAKIRSTVTHLKTFENIQDCEEYFHHISNDDRIIFIVSGQSGQEILPRIHHYRQIFSIYVYCMDKNLNKEWIKHFAKIKGVITQFDHLLNQIQMDLSKRTENQIDEPLILNMSIDKSTDKLNNDFLYSQLLIDCLLRMKSNVTDKNELINYCRKIYQNNPNQLDLIRQFEENYSSEQAIWWYTREAFIYRLLNKALRTDNIDLLYLFRFLIRDIENQLKSSHCLSTIRVYRGQLMSKEEFQRLKTSIGEYLSVKSFFSTSLNREKAIEFLNNYTFANDLYKVLFEIDVNSPLKYIKSFANISSLSFYKNEQEILFMIGSIFRLIYIKEDKNGFWIVQMILSDHQDENLRNLFNSIKNEYININQQTNLISFGNILYQMGKYDLAEKYFIRLLNHLSQDDPDISRCYHALGVLALIKDNSDVSLQWHEKSLKTLNKNDSRLADSYNCIGCIYQRKEDFQKALNFYNKALLIWQNCFGDDYYQIADCLNNIGCLYETEKNYAKALEYHQKALSIRQKSLPKDHPDLGGSYNNIGNIYFCLEEYDLALENYKLSYEIKLKSLPSQHSSLASTLENIGLVYEQKQLFDQALIYYEKAADIFREIFSSTHIHVIEIEENIKYISSLITSQIRSTKF